MIPYGKHQIHSCVTKAGVRLKDTPFFGQNMKVNYKMYMNKKEILNGKVLK